ncbi:MAG: hypothetical protein NT061_11795 [Spirochaetes bacterium]|nr:hypothetical protein [Spirochaetota bacterium]
MILLIHDANVLIDLISIDLLDLALSLPFRMATTDLVRREIEDPGQACALASCIERGRLGIINSTIQEMKAIADSMERCTRLSLADCSVLYHAAKVNGIVISGDGKLRKEAMARHMEVHGTPWILSQLVESSGVSISIAIEKLERLMEMNPRLPHKECQKLLDAWRSYN